MNGVRRFLGSVAATQSPPEPIVQPSQAAQVSKPSWPPSPHVAGTAQAEPHPLAGSPNSQVPGLSIRKDRHLQRFALQAEDGDGINSSPSARSGSSISPFASPSGSQSSATTASPKLHGRTTDVLFDSPKAGSSRLRHSGLPNTRDELLMSLLASEAVIDSREVEILSAEVVEELKKVCDSSPSQLIPHLALRSTMSSHHDSHL
jgi:hypothetical protein